MKKEAEEWFKWFDDREYPKTELKLTEGQKIGNIEKFVASHLPMARANYHKKTYHPYIKRLQKVREYIENGEI